MKKLIGLTVMTVLLCSFSASSQGFEKGVKNINLGLGLGYGGIGVAGSFDVGVTDDISAGGEASFSAGRLSYSLYTVGVRAAYHFGNLINLPDTGDLYGGAGLGYRGISGLGTYAYGRGIYFRGFAGYRHALSNKFGLYAEAGFPISSVGITLRM